MILNAQDYGDCKKVIKRNLRPLQVINWGSFNNGCVITPLFASVWNPLTFNESI